jgi:hypothetical protein
MRYNKIIVTISVQIPLTVMLLAKSKLVCLLMEIPLLVWPLVNSALFIAFIRDANMLPTDIMTVCLFIGNVICLMVACVATWIYWRTKGNLDLCFRINDAIYTGMIIVAVIITSKIIIKPDESSDIVVMLALISSMIAFPSRFCVMTCQYCGEDKGSNWEQSAKEEIVPINHKPTDTQTKQSA